MRIAPLCALTVLLCAPPTHAAAPFAVPPIKEIIARFQPFRVEQAVLAPDGQHVAYTVREGPLLSVVVADANRPEIRTAIPVGQDDEDARVQGAAMDFVQMKIPVRVTHLEWADARRLVYAATVPTGVRGAVPAVFVVDADGKNARQLIDGYALSDSGTSATGFRVLGFRFGDPNSLALEVLGGWGNVSSLHRLDLNTGKAPIVTYESERGRYLYDQQANARLHESIASWSRSNVDLTRAGGRLEGLAIDYNPRGAGPLVPNAPVLVYQPQSFRYRAAERRGRWEDFEKMLGSAAPFQFQRSIETFYGARSFPLAFDADPNVLYFASNVGRDTYGLYALDLRTKQRTDFAVEDATYDLVDLGDTFSDDVLVFSRERRLVGVRLPGPRPKVRWLDRDLARLQSALDAKFPNRDVTIAGWDDARKRVLALVSTAADPGRYFVFDDGQPGQLREFVRRAPAFAGDAINKTTPFAFETPGGVRLSGMLTVPAQPRIAPTPLVLLCRDVPGLRDRAEFDFEMQALADLGFFVATVNYRGTAGLGAKHRDAIRGGFDTLPIEDLRAAVAWIAARQPINPRRVALVGQDFGGYLAMRAVQLHPQEFRCVVAINAPVSPVQWSESTFAAASRPGYEMKLRDQFFDQAILKKLTAPPLGDTLAKPTMIVQDERKVDLATMPGKGLLRQLKSRGIPTEYEEASIDFTRRDVEARAQVFSKVAGFLNDYIYDHGVDIGAMKEVK
jgi:dipeptidyl aminopeptidase/acylaminoacyl peptidase